jgi:hypothetical protein
MASAPSDGDTSQQRTPVSLMSATAELAMLVS